MVVENVETKNRKIFYISFLAVLSAISVVIMHGSIYRYDAGNPSNFWFISNFILCFFFFAVPIFYMISGATLMDYRTRYDSKVYFLKRLRKVVIPFCFWLVILCLFNIYFLKIPMDGNILLYLYNICIEQSLYWFFIPLFAIYLLIPLLSYVPKEKRIKLFSFYAILLFIFCSVIPCIFNLTATPIYIRPEFVFASGLFIYPFLGYILNEIELKRKYRIIFYVLGILGLLGMFLPTQVFYETMHQSTYMFKSYSYPTTILYSIAVWIFAKELCKHNNFRKRIEKIVYLFNPYTFGIYLIHYYFINIIAHYFKLNIVSMGFSVAIPIIVIPLCLLTLYIMKKIPYVKNIVP
ncbi:acyltransferase [Methanobrevibacter woesei]|uniref:acyltransferase n=1 Tax=Methanobrevibacter woesei TaxID=190976 RepID=UPI0023F50049|nr:acyltransferase [Methanobrevibacter woesei]